MKCEWSSAAPGVLRAIPALTFISVSFSLGAPHASGALPEDRPQAGPGAAILPAAPARSLPLAKNRLEATLMRVPLNFEPNQGQTASTVEFLSRGSGYGLFFARGQVVVKLSADSLRMSLIGANSQAKAVGLEKQGGVVSYFIGNNPKKWRTGIPTYGKVEYAQVYPGVDLVLYGNQRELEYDFVVAPGADPGRIAWRIEGARAGVDAEGNLVLRSRSDPVTFRKPVVYQMEGNRKIGVDGSFDVSGNEVRFRLGPYDHSRALTIDPVLSYATYLAGTGNDYIGRPTGPGILLNGTSQGLAVDSAGSVYVTGRTGSVDFPMANAYEGSFPARLPGTGPTYTPTTFVTKFSPDGSSLVYSTYLGGDSEDDGYAIAVDSAGEAYVTGSTTSANFPITSGAYQTLCGPTVYAGQASATCPGSMNAFVTKLNARGTGLVYSTFLGGYGNTWATGIAVDAAGRAYVAGNQDNTCNTSQMSTCFPTTGGAVISTTEMACCSQFTFMAVFDPTGANLLYSTLFGDLNDIQGSTTVSSGETAATAATVDAKGNFYLVGWTKAGKLPTTLGVVQPTTLLDPTNSYSPAFRGFAAKFNPVTSTDGASLAWATYLGGHTSNTSDYISGIAIDSASNVYLAGYTNSSDFPVTQGAYNTVCGVGGVCAAAHVTKLNPTATSIGWSTYVGGARQDGGDDMFFTGPVQLDGEGNVYIIGTANPEFPLINPVEPAITGGSGDVVVAELDPTGSHLLFSSQVGSGGRDASGPGGFVVDSAGDIYAAGYILGPDLITTPGAFQTTNPAPTCCEHGYIAKITPSVGPLITVVGTTPAVTNAATFQAGGIAPNEFISLFGTGLGPATGVSSAMTTELAGTSVSIGGIPAYLTYAQNGQVNVLVPFHVSGLVSTTIQVEYNGVAGNSVTVPVVASSPGIFTQEYGPGQVWMVNQDNTFNSSSNPAARNSYVAFWVTGQGLVNTTLSDGTQPSGPPFATPLLPVSVSLGGTEIPAANVVFDGLVYCGEIQVNILIPENAPTGNAVPLVVTIGGASSRTDATIAIQ